MLVRDSRQAKRLTGLVRDGLGILGQDRRRDVTLEREKSNCPSGPAMKPSMVEAM